MGRRRDSTSRIGGGEEVQGRQRDGKKGINQHRFHYSVGGGAISIHQRNAIPRTRAPQLHHRRRLTSVSLPTAFPAFSKPRPRAFHSFATPPNPDGTGPRVKQCGAGSGAFPLL